MKRILLVTAAVLFGMNMSAQNLVSNSMFDTDMTGWTQLFTEWWIRGDLGGIGRYFSCEK